MAATEGNTSSEPNPQSAGSGPQHKKTKRKRKNQENDKYSPLGSSGLETVYTVEKTWHVQQIKEGPDSPRYFCQQQKEKCEIILVFPTGTLEKFLNNFPFSFDPNSEVAGNLRRNKWPQCFSHCPLLLVLIKKKKVAVGLSNLIAAL